MNCRQADALMMKYMDGVITEEEARQLNEHLLHCQECRDSFRIYDMMLQEFSVTQPCLAPEGFECQVLAKITEISESQYQVTYTIASKIKGIVWGTFTVLFGAGALLVFYQEPIMRSLIESPYVGQYIRKFIPVSHAVDTHKDTFLSVANNAYHTVDATISNSVGLILVLMAAICAIQAILLRQKRKMSKAEEK